MNCPANSSNHNDGAFFVEDLAEQQYSTDIFGEVLCLNATCIEFWREVEYASLYGWLMEASDYLVRYGVDAGTLYFDHR